MLKHVLGVMILVGVSAAASAQTTQLTAAPAESVATAATPSEAPPADVENYIKLESKSGGELDFMKIMAPKKQNMFVHDGHMYTKQEYALMLWGMKVKELGLESAERACALYASVSTRPLTAKEKQAIANGFANATQEE